MVPDFIYASGFDILAESIIIFTSFFIFFRTKEFYELSAHQGIKFFHYTFLFFGISFFIELVRHFLPLFPVHELRPIFLIISVYAGTMAMFCLLYSVIWRKLRLPSPFLFLNGVALVFALLMWLGRFRPHILGLQVVLFIVVLCISYANRKKVRIHLLYLLLFLSWIAYTAASFAIWVSAAASIVLNIVAVALFLLLAYKVLQRTRVT